MQPVSCHHFLANCSADGCTHPQLLNLPSVLIFKYVLIVMILSLIFVYNGDERVSFGLNLKRFANIFIALYDNM